MAKLTVEVCPETGICSIIRKDGSKLDLMPDELNALRQAAGKPEEVKKALAEVDPQFAKKLDADEVRELGREIA